MNAVRPRGRASVYSIVGLLAAIALAQQPSLASQLVHRTAPTALVAAQGSVSTMTADSATLWNLTYTGNVDVPTASGGSVQAMALTTSAATFVALGLDGPCTMAELTGTALKSVILTAPGQPSTAPQGITFYAVRVQATLPAQLGGTTIVWTPDAAPTTPLPPILPITALRVDLVQAAVPDTPAPSGANDPATLVLPGLKQYATFC